MEEGSKFSSIRSLPGYLTGPSGDGNVAEIIYTVFCPGFQKGRVPSEKGTLAR